VTNHFWLEQNPLKNSKYWIAYRQLKAVYPDLYLFWEIKDGKYTWRLKLEILTKKEDMDKVIASLIWNEEFMKYEDIWKSE